MLDVIKSNIEISELFANGKRVHTPYCTLICLPYKHDRADTRCGRVAFIAGKKLGNAVWRNAAKRRMRAVCAELGGPVPGYDVVFLAKSKLTMSSYQDVLTACRSAFDRIGAQTSKEMSDEKK